MRPEDRLQRRVRMYLAAVVPLPPEAFWSSIEHGRVHKGTDLERAIEWGQLKAKGIKTGLPDVILIWCMKFVAIELKATTAMRPAQKAFRDAWLANGGVHIEARSVVEVDAALRSAGLPIPRSMGIAAMGHDAALSVAPQAKRKGGGRRFDFDGDVEAAASADRLQRFLAE